MDTAFRLLGRTATGLAVFCLLCTTSASSSTPVSDSAMRRAFNYLLDESSNWSGENNCFSCHNNGDAVRALLAYQQEPHTFAGSSWRKLIKWFDQPGEWLKSPSDEFGESPILTFIQFGTARLAAQSGGLMAKNRVIESAIQEELLKSQSPEGYWKVEPEGHIGSPGTYGNALASFQAISILGTKQGKKFEAALERCLNWAFRQDPKSTTDVAAICLLLSLGENDATKSRSSKWSQHLIRNQNTDGGWGVFPRRYSEVFDTAIASLAITQTLAHPESKASLIKARRFLEETQESTGGWPETTRPSGGVSYAQHISTTAWALQALIHLSESNKTSD